MNDRDLRTPREHVKTEPKSTFGDGFRKSHPAFGMIHFIRSNGAQGPFFGSEIDHHFTTFKMQVTCGTHEWALHESRFFGGGTPIVEVEMTAAQFVQLLTTMNVGSGVPCTITRGPLEDIRAGGRSDEVPGIIDNHNTHAQMKSDLKESVSEVVARMNKLMKSLETALADSGLSQKKKDALKRDAEMVSQQLRDNLPFVLTQYEEALEHKKTAHLAEVDATITTMIHNLGMRSMTQLLEASNDAATPKLSADPHA